MAVVALIDGATLNGIDSATFTGKKARESVVSRTTSSVYDFFQTVVSNPANGQILVGGSTYRRVNQSTLCWNYTGADWGSTGSIDIPTLVKYESNLELPTVRG